MNKFDSISIAGRYIYGYLCLRRAIQVKELEPIPDVLDGILAEFVSTNKLDFWQDIADEVAPSSILNSDKTKGHRLVNKDVWDQLHCYYSSQPKLILDLIEELIGLGTSNLYCAFDSTITMAYLESIISILDEHKIELPEFSKIEQCDAKERNGWGQLTTLSKFIT